MLPTELSHHAQERCQELRGEIRESSTPFFDVSPSRVLASFFYCLVDKLMSKPKTQVAREVKTH
jgi:hypothetical protein